jgi:hypothetical protein
MLSSAEQDATIEANETELEASKAEIQLLQEKVGFAKSTSSDAWLMCCRWIASSDSSSRR